MAKRKTWETNQLENSILAQSNWIPRSQNFLSKCADSTPFSPTRLPFLHTISTVWTTIFPWERTFITADSSVWSSFHTYLSKKCMHFFFYQRSSFLWFMDSPCPERMHAQRFWPEHEWAIRIPMSLLCSQMTPRRLFYPEWSHILVLRWMSMSFS